MFDNQKIKKIENFLPQCYSDELNSIFSLEHFPWYYLENVAGLPEDKLKEMNGYGSQIGFGHIFFDQGEGVSPFFHEILPLIYFIAEKFDTNLTLHNLLRIRAGMSVNVDKENNIVHHPHVDYGDLKHKTMLYYVNDSDGDTIFYKNIDGDLEPHYRISPVKNTAVLFDGDIYHSSSTPKENSNRITININFTEME